jgi:hypothetical protein
MPGVWTIAKLPLGNGLTVEADGCKQALLRGRLSRQPRSGLNIREEKPHGSASAIPFAVYALINASKSAFTLSFRVEHIPCGAPG